MSFTQHRYVVYVDESGDHGLASVDPAYPVFVLAFCIFERRAYVEQTSAAVQHLKFQYFGHDMVILHERDIRKSLGPFAILQDIETRRLFLDDLSRIIESAPMCLLACCIRKDKMQLKYKTPDHPYHLAMKFGLERIYRFLGSNPTRDPTYFVCERRGRREDKELESEFRRICAGANYASERFPFEIVMADKKTNSAGLQLADLVARPIGRRVMAPEQENRAFDILAQKFDSRSDGEYLGYGLKIFP